MLYGLNVLLLDFVLLDDLHGDKAAIIDDAFVHFADDGTVNMNKHLHSDFAKDKDLPGNVLNEDLAAFLNDDDLRGQISNNVVMSMATSRFIQQHHW